MNRRVWFFGALLVLAGLTSCTETNEEASDLFQGEIETGFVESISSASLPTAVQSAISTDYPGESISQASRITSSDMTNLYAATFRSGSEATYSAEGREADSIGIEELPAAAISFVNDSFPDEVITKAVRVTKEDDTIRYIVRISSGEILTFDEAGEFLFERRRKGNKRRKGRRHGTEIETTELPTAAQTYLTTNYPSDPIVKALSFNRGEGEQYYVVKLESGERVAFDSEGNMIEGCQGRWGDEDDEDEEDGEEEGA